jgi:hypothetical protein
MTTEIKFDIASTNIQTVLGVEVWLDQVQLLDVPHVTSLIPVCVKIDDSELDRELKIVLKNKQESDTVIDSQGNIVSDSCLIVNNFKFDEIAADQLVSEQAVYYHSFNSGRAPESHRFYWSMGCNGTVSLKFTSPAYIWILENM